MEKTRLNERCGDGVDGVATMCFRTRAAKFWQVSNDVLLHAHQALELNQAIGAGPAARAERLGPGRPVKSIVQELAPLQVPGASARHLCVLPLPITINRSMIRRLMRGPQSGARYLQLAS